MLSSSEWAESLLLVEPTDGAGTGSSCGGGKRSAPLLRLFGTGLSGQCINSQI